MSYPWKTLLLSALAASACDFADPPADESAPGAASTEETPADPGQSASDPSERRASTAGATAPSPMDSEGSDANPTDSDNPASGSPDPDSSGASSSDSDGPESDSSASEGQESGPSDADSMGGEPADPDNGADPAAEDSEPNEEQVASADPDPYPSGPYGFGEGDTVPDVELWDEDGTSVRLSELRAREEVKVFVWSSGAEWCPICRIQAEKLQQLHTSKSQEGLFVLESLYQSTNRRPADPETLKRWKGDLGVTYLLLTEPDPNYANHTDNPLELVIDAQTMKVRYRQLHVTSDLAVHVDAALSQASP